MARSVVDAPHSLRRSTRHRNSSGSNPQPSGSEYSANASVSADSDDKHMDADAEGDHDGPRHSSRRRRPSKRIVIDDPDGAGAGEDEDESAREVVPYTTARGRITKRAKTYKEEESDIDLFTHDDGVDIVPRRGRSSARLRGFIVSDDDGEAGVGARYATRSRARKPGAAAADTPPSDGSARERRSLRRNSRRVRHEDDGYVEEVDLDAEGSPDIEIDLDAPQTSPSPEPEPEDNGPKTYSFRTRTKQINYAIPPPLEEVRPAKGPVKSKGKSRAGPGWSANGTELGRYMGMPADDSDSDYPTRTPRKPFGAGAGGGLFAAGGGGLFSNDLAAAAGTPSNLGKVGDSALADADPLGVNTNVTFDEIGGLDDHINSLKEMTLLPLLYPEVFQRFNLTPPRGVLFHGPPGTGKTLLARALAASCRSNGKGISFFMRKGADCLSKWVGEAERQLRLLFEEARTQQPSIIFFDEIDGLAPVRSAKQDQIHASIVSTLLALMDGMDGRGQVVVIGATNRPDAVDPALRRPGRFDREFYFPLPAVAARERILGIITRKWDGWQGGQSEEAIKGLAKITKGYGGADLRALCTEAALNAVQRRYPQIYKSTDRLQLQPETIHVQPRDFMVSVKKIVPSSARSTSSTAAPLPKQLEALLEETLEAVKAVVGKALPVSKKRTALEEAEWEEEDGGGLDREVLLQSMETLRVYRPRVVIHGPAGMGQAYVGAAALHHLEGYHIQTLDLGNLLGDSTRTAEAAIVQLFVEAKRHQPSVIYIPSLIGYCAAVSETSRITVRAMLDSLGPTDPIIVLAVVDGPFASLPRDVRAWFGVTRENRVALSNPSLEKRERFFGELLGDVRRPPNQFPDGVKRKKRVLEELPIAPPLEPRQLTVAELAVQEESDRRVITLLIYRLGPIISELKRKFKRFTKRAADEYNLGMDPFLINFNSRLPEVPIAMPVQQNGIIEIVNGEQQPQLPNGLVNGIHPQSLPPPPPPPKIYDVDLERINVDLYKGKYLTPHDFLEDIAKIVHNAEARQDDDSERLFKAQAMFTAAQVSINEFDAQLRLECERMAVRERERRSQRKEAKEKGKNGADAANGNGNGNGGGTYAPGTRRSARNNGQQPEISITDPLELERKLKRQRSNDTGADSHESGEEDPDNRMAKRTRIETAEADDSGDRDPLDLVGPTSSQPRPLAVRFAHAQDIEISQPSPLPSADLLDVSNRQFTSHSPEPSRQPGFNPDLLNPVLPPLPSLDAYMAPSLDGQSADLAPSTPTLTSSVHDVSISIISEPVVTPQSMFDLGSFPLQQRATASLEPPRTPRRSPAPTSSLTPIMEQAEGEAQHEAAAHSPMEIVRERTPSRPPTPLPAFHVDEHLLSGLAIMLSKDTSSLNIEQLEQLRATCLGCVWRHRQSWDRDGLVRELVDVVKEFVEEVDLDAREQELAYSEQ